ncbi:MAG: hypothetical protein ACW99Q_16945, partial [Candidatus Kariarchaeaceae archaeon]
MFGPVGNLIQGWSQQQQSAQLAQDMQYMEQLQGIAVDYAMQNSLSYQMILHDINTLNEQINQQQLQQLQGSSFDISQAVEIALSIPGMFTGGLGVLLFSNMLELNMDAFFDDKSRSEAIQEQMKSLTQGTFALDKRIQAMLSFREMVSNVPGIKRARPQETEVHSQLADVIEEMEENLKQIKMIKNAKGDRNLIIQRKQEALANEELISVITVSVEGMEAYDPKFVVSNRKGYWSPVDSDTEIPTVQFDIPLDYTFEEIKTELNWIFHQTGDFELWWNGIEMTEGSIYNNFKIEKDTTWRNIQKKWGITEEDVIYLQPRFQSYGKRLEDQFLGFSKIKTHSSHYFKNQFWIIFGNYKGALALDRLYTTLIDPVKKAFLKNFDLIESDGDISLDKIKESFKKFMLKRWNNPSIIRLIKIYGLTDKWNEFVDDLFYEYFAPGFTADLSVGYSKNKIINIIEERLESLIFDIFMREYIKIDDTYSTSHDIVNRIDDIFNSGKIFNIIRDFDATLLGMHGKGLTYFMEVISRSFFLNPLHNRMTRGYRPNTYHGAILEADIFFNQLPLKVAKLYRLYSNSKFTFYSYADLVPNSLPVTPVADFNRKLVTDFKKLEFDLFGFDTSSLDAPSKGRAPDLGVYDFMSLVLTNHLKNTWNMEDSSTRSRIRDAITTDALSAQLLDFYSQVWTRNDYIRSHTNDLYSPLTYGKSGASLETAAKEVMKSLLSKNNLIDLLGKVSSKHLYLFKVAELINSYVQRNYQLINSFTDAIDYIKDLFAEPEFQSDLYELTEDFYSGEKLKHILGQGSSFYIDLETVFVDNLDNLITESSSQFSIQWGAYITYYFDTDSNGESVSLTRNFLPANAKYLEIDKDGNFLVDSNGSPLLQDLTAAKLQELLKKSKLKETLANLMVAHDKYDAMSFIVYDSRLQNRLPDGIFEGYSHQGNDKYKDQIFHGVILNNIYSDLMFGRVHFNGDGTISILPEDWFLDYLKFTTDGDTISTSYYTYFGYTTGNYHVGSMQASVTNLVATKPFKDYMPWISQKDSKLETLEYPGITAQEKLAIYGDEFTQEKFNKLYASLLTPTGKEISRKTIPMATKYLDYLN